jgi:HhH-GPD superfamily base excision DNA repair protein
LELAYGPESPEVVALAADPVMAAVTAAIGDVRVGVQPDRFVSLASAIVGQQLSGAAASTIWRRFAALGPVEPAAVLSLDEVALRSCGLSGQKARYLRDLSERVFRGDLDLDSLDALEDEAVIAEVTRVKGVGRWTAEMFLLFSSPAPTCSHSTMEGCCVRRGGRSSWGALPPAPNSPRPARRGGRIAASRRSTCGRAWTGDSSRATALRAG